MNIEIPNGSKDKRVGFVRVMILAGGAKGREPNFQTCAR
jgi:hypothetical protein